MCDVIGAVWKVKLEGENVSLLGWGHNVTNETRPDQKRPDPLELLEQIGTQTIRFVSHDQVRLGFCGA
jgi:hypothetical protein